MIVHIVLECLSFVVEFTELVILSKGYGESNKALLLDGANNKPASHLQAPPSFSMYMIY